MKKYRRVALLVAAMFLTVSHASARNYFYLSGAVGYAAHLDDVDMSKPAFGMGGAFGLGYELQRGHFLFNVGAEANYEYTANKIDDASISFSMHDTEGEPFTYQGEVRDRRDGSRQLNFKVPLMLGAQFGRFYFLAGGKVGFNVMGKAKSSATLHTVGDYPQFIDIFQNMPNHGFDNTELTSEDDISFGLSAALAGEIGFNLGETRSGTGFSLIRKNSTTKFRLALFAEYGLLNIHDNVSRGSMLMVNTDQYLQARLNHVYLSDEAWDKVVNPLSVGVKFTILFQGKSRGKCIRCDVKDM